MKRFKHELKKFLKIRNVIVPLRIKANWPQWKCLFITLFKLAYDKYGPNHYLADHIALYTKDKQLAAICARAKSAPANLDWLQIEGYFYGDDFEIFKKNYLKEFTRQQRAKHCLKQFFKTVVRQNLHFEQVLAYVYHTTGDVPYPFEHTKAM